MEMTRLKTVIITGATGFIGRWLLSDLIKNNIDITVLVRDKDKIQSCYRDKIKIYESEYFDYDKLEIQLKEYDVFFHLAWSGTASEDKDKIDIQLKNIDIALASLTLAKKLKCKKFIATGTVAEYAFCEQIMDFSQRQTPGDVYSAVKTSVYYLLKVLTKKADIGFIWAVLPSTYGEGRNNNNIITYTIVKLLNGEYPLYGSLEQLWDFLYVKEVARALRLIGERGISGKIYGIGSGQYRKLKDYIYMIRDLIDPSLKLGIGELPEMSKKAFSSCVGIYDLIRDTNFKVEIGFEDGIKNTIEYYKNMHQFKQ